ncbi:hypothetical protein Aduo_018011 [Ancylostoma duodenale]
MKFFGALLLLIACLASLASSIPVRVKRQWGVMPPYDYGPPPYSGYGDGYYGGGYFGYGPRPYYRRRRPVVIEKTVVYRPGWYG